MTKKKSPSPKSFPDTQLVITLASTASGLASSGQGTLLMQRGDLATLRQFTYTRLEQLGEVIQAASHTLMGLTIDPPTQSTLPVEVEQESESFNTPSMVVADVPVPSTLTPDPQDQLSLL